MLSDLYFQLLQLLVSVSPQQQRPWVVFKSTQEVEQIEPGMHLRLVHSATMAHLAGKCLRRLWAYGTPSLDPRKNALAPTFFATFQQCFTALTPLTLQCLHAESIVSQQLYKISLGQFKLLADLVEFHQQAFGMSEALVGCVSWWIETFTLRPDLRRQLSAWEADDMRSKQVERLIVVALNMARSLMKHPSIGNYYFL